MTQLSSRTFPRVSFEAPLLLQTRAEPSDSVPARTFNLSQQGMFVTSEVLYQVGTELDAALPLPEATTRVRGRVAWVRPDGADGAPARPRGMGIEFVDLTQRSSRLIDRVVQRCPLERQEVKLSFQQAPPIRARALVIDEGIRLTTRLPFLRLTSPVRVSVRDGEAQGTIERVNLQTCPDDAVPRLQIDVALDDDTGIERRAGNDNRSVSGEIEIPAALPAALQPRAEPTRDPAAVGDLQRPLARGPLSPPETAAPSTVLTSVTPLQDDAPTTSAAPTTGGRGHYSVWIASGLLATASVALLAAVLASDRGSPAEPPAEPPRVRYSQAAPATPAEPATASTDTTKATEARPPEAQATKASPDEPGIPPASATAHGPLAVALAPERARLSLAIAGSVEGAEVYPLANPRGVGVRLPRAEVVAGLGRHAVRQGPLNSVLVRPMPEGGCRVLLFYRSQRARDHRVALSPGLVVFDIDR